MGLAVNASRLSFSWVTTATALITAITLFNAAPAAAAASKSAKSAKAAKSNGKVAKSAKPRAAKKAVAKASTAKLKATEAKSRPAPKAAVASRSGGRSKPVASKRVARTSKGKATRVARSLRRSYAVAKARLHRPEVLVAHLDDEILSIAASYLGTPYSFGSSGGGSFDCSGFVRTVYSEIGMDLPHSASAQFTMGERVDPEELQPGDLVFFRTYRRGASHVGIYVGDDYFIHAASKGGEVRFDSLDQSYFRTRYLGARRLRGSES